MEKAKRASRTTASNSANAKKTNAVHSKRSQVEAGSDYSKTTHAKTNAAKKRASKTSNCGK